MNLVESDLVRQVILFFFDFFFFIQSLFELFSLLFYYLTGLKFLTKLVLLSVLSF